MDPPIIQFVGGLAQTDYVACRTGGPLPCPEYVTVYAAFTSAPLEAFAQSAPIRLFDETETFMSQVSDDGCEAGLGRVAYRNDLSVGAERLETFGVGSTNFDSDAEVLRLQLEQAVVAMRFAPDSVDSGTLTLRAEDLAVTSAEAVARLTADAHGRVARVRHRNHGADLCEEALALCPQVQVDSSAGHAVFASADVSFGIQVERP